jgi:hypothetical protein
MNKRTKRSCICFVGRGECKVQLSELRPEAIRLILGLVSVAKGRMNSGTSSGMQNIPEGSRDEETDAFEKLGKTPKCFPKSSDW